MYKFDRNHQFKLSDFNQPIYCAVHHCDECQPLDRYYFALYGDIDLFKVQMAERPA